jgi:predicted metal-dependent hydrolase
LDFKKIELFKTSNKTVSYPGIGSVTFKRNSRARRLSISVKNSACVKVTIPGTLSFRSAESFVLSKSKWIIEKVEYFSNREVKLNQLDVYRTRKHTLHFIPSTNDKIVVKIKFLDINVHYPENIEISNEQVQIAAKKGIEHAYRIEAKEVLPVKVNFLANKFGYNFSKIGIKKATTRWGSCSSRNNINLSIFLMKLPDELIDYIILHELCHTVHKNHGPKFWAELDRVTEGNAKKLSKEVKAFKAGI